MENFRTQSFSIATFDTIGITIGTIFGTNVALNHVAANADLGPAAFAGIMAGAPVGIALAKGGPLITGIASAMIEKEPLTMDVVDPKIYNDGTGWKAGTIAGLALGLAMTWNMNANPIKAHNLMAHLPWNTSQTVTLEANAGPAIEQPRPV